jgi:HAD superfamily phosphatase (TIGR01668 family)
MMRLFRPRELASSIFDIDFARLYREGKRVVLFDLDNTLGRRWPKQLDPDVVRLLENLKRMGFQVGILTNRRQTNGDQVIEQLAQNYPLLHRASKPSKKGFLQLLKEFDAPPREAVMVGDRLLTDVFGANRLEIYSVRIRRV